jgi:CRISPR-associated protein Cas5h
MRQDQIELDINQVYGDNPLSLHMLRMPRMLSETRVFRHASYILEKDALPVPVRTSEAYKVGGKVLMFL